MTDRDITDRELWKQVYITAIQMGQSRDTAKLTADLAVKEVPR